MRALGAGAGFRRTRRPLFRHPAQVVVFGFGTAVLVGALLLVANGHTVWGWAYFGYSAFNGVAGWLILSRRV